MKFDNINSNLKYMSKLNLIFATIILTSLNAQAWMGANNTELITIVDTKNDADTNGYGSVTKSYSIGKYEVTNEQYAAFLSTVGTRARSGVVNVSIGDNDVPIYEENANLGGINIIVRRYIAKSGKENNAVNFVSAYGAAMYCNWLTNGATQTSDYLSGLYDFNKYGATIELFENVDDSKLGYKLPTLDQWYKAAYYTTDKNASGESGYYQFATQSDIAPKNSKATSLGNTANYANSVKQTTQVGAYTNSESFYGTFDQNGNVGEWCETIVGSSLPLLGGDYSSTSSLLNSGSAGSDLLSPSSTASNAGFRVMYTIPEPSFYSEVLGGISLGLMMLKKIFK